VAETAGGWAICAGRPTKGDHVKLKIGKEGISPGDICEVKGVLGDRPGVAGWDSKLTKLGASSVEIWFKEAEFDKVQLATAGKPVAVQKPAAATHYLFRHPERDLWYLHHAPFDPATFSQIVSTAHVIAAGNGPVPTGARTWRVRTGGKWVSAEVTVRELDAVMAQAAQKEQRRKALDLPVTATDGECEAAELAAMEATAAQVVTAAAQAQLEAATASGERIFNVGGVAVAFEVAQFGPSTAALVSSAVPAVPLLANEPLTNPAELRGKIAVVHRGNDPKTDTGIPFWTRAWRAQQAGAAAIVIVHNESDTPVAWPAADHKGDTHDDRRQSAAISIPAVCVGKDAGRLLLGGAAVVTIGYNKPAEDARGRQAAVQQEKLVVRPC
jgi:hypothetical protein